MCDKPTNMTPPTPPPMHELLAKYEHGFYCDDCGEPAVELRPYWINAVGGFEARWCVGMSCAEHSEGDRRIVEWLRGDEHGFDPTTASHMADAIERGEHRG